MRNPQTNPFSVFMNAVSNHYLGIIAVLVIGTACYLFIVKGEIPDALEKFAYIILAFLFGSKVGNTKSETVKSE